MVHAFEWVGDSIKNVTVDTHALSGGFGVLQAVLHPLLELLHEMGDLLHYVQDQASHAVDKLMELAGMSPAAPNIAGTKDVNEAAKELGVTLKKKSDDTPAANDASAKQITAPHVSDAAAASPAAAATNAGTTLSTPAIAAVAAASVGPVLAAVGSPAMQAIAGPLAATQPRAKQAPAYRDIRTELTDATPDTEGNYHVRSNSGGGIGGTLTAEMYQNLRRRNAEQQSGTARTWRMTARIVSRCGNAAAPRPPIPLPSASASFRPLPATSGAEAGAAERSGRISMSPCRPRSTATKRPRHWRQKFCPCSKR